MASSEQYGAHVEEMYNARDLDGLIDSYAEDAVMSVPEVEGALGGGRRFEFVVGEGDLVVEEFHYRGTNTRDPRMRDGTIVPPTGEHIEIMGIELFQLRDGEIVRHDVFHPTGAQLGLLPMPAAA